MVILIGGVSCSGKTLMAQRLLEKYKIPYLSIDHLKMGLIRGNKYCDFKATDSDASITDKLWPVIKGIIMTNIENNQHIIIEGCYIPPEQVKDFAPEYMSQIIPFYIGFSKNYIEEHMITGIIEHRSEIELKDYDDYMNQENFIAMHTRLKEQCEKNDALFFEINENYEQEMKQVYAWIDEEVKKRV
jgi:2-phosphoglycerate kinase